MGTLIATYAIAWTATLAYAAWIALGNRALARRLQQLESSAESDCVLQPATRSAA